MYTVLLTLSLLTVSLVDKVKCQEGVQVLTDDNFDAALENKNVLVSFYAEWCRHSQALKPHFRNLSADFKTLNCDVVIAEVDAEEQEELAKRFEIKRYPTIIFFKNGEPTKYTGRKKAMELMDWLKDKIDC